MYPLNLPIDLSHSNCLFGWNAVYDVLHVKLTLRPTLLSQSPYSVQPTETITELYVERLQLLSDALNADRCKHSVMETDFCATRSLCESREFLFTMSHKYHPYSVWSHRKRSRLIVVGFFVKCMLESIGFSDVWLCQCVGDRDLFVKIYTERFGDVFFHNRSERLSLSSRAVFYKSIEHNLSFGQYLEQVNATQYRIALCKLIVSSHRLRIETGRWERPPVSRGMRQCEICHKGVEDEFHFVLVWPALQHQQQEIA